jgi:hypothetical protein
MAESLLKNDVLVIISDQMIKTKEVTVLTREILVEVRQRTPVVQQVLT